MTITLPKKQLFFASLILLATVIHCTGRSGISNSRNFAFEKENDRKAKIPGIRPIRFNYLTKGQPTKPNPPQPILQLNKNNQSLRDSNFGSENLSQLNSLRKAQFGDKKIENRLNSSINQKDKSVSLGHSDAYIEQEEKLPPIHDNHYLKGQEYVDNITYDDNQSIPDEYDYNLKNSANSYGTDLMEIEEPQTEEYEQFGFDIDKLIENEEAEDLKDNLSSKHNTPNSSNSRNLGYDVSDDFIYNNDNIFAPNEINQSTEQDEEDFQPRFIARRGRNPGVRSKSADDALMKKDSSDSEDSMLNCLQARQPKAKRALVTMSVTQDKEGNEIFVPSRRARNQQGGNRLI